jgi:ketosteroid isomerase-like protein
VNTDDEARALVHAWWHRVWGEGDLDLMDEILTDPYTRHTSLGTETITVREYKLKLANSQRALYRPNTVFNDEVVAGDKVWIRATSTGVNLETGDVANMTWLVIHRIENGRLAEAWIAALAGVRWDR